MAEAAHGEPVPGIAMSAPHHSLPRNPASPAASPLTVAPHQFHHRTAPVMYKGIAFAALCLAVFSTRTSASCRNNLSGRLHKAMPLQTVLYRLCTSYA